MLRRPMFGWVAVFALLGVVVVELLRLPGAAFAAGPATWLPLAGHITIAALGALWPALLGLPVAIVGPRLRARSRLMIAMSLCFAVALVVASYAVLIGYHRFLGYAPLVLLWLGLLGYLLVAHAAAHRLWSWSQRALVRWGLAAAGLFGFVAVSHANATMFVGRYPTLHVALFIAQFGLLHAGLALLFRGRRVAPAHVAIAAVPAALVVIGLLWSPTPAAHSTWRAHAVLGQASVLGDELPTPELCAEPVPALPPDRAAAVFAEHSGLPRLPAGFRATDYNLLLVTVEALRYDQTSLAGHHATTPNLARLVERGAYTFSRARAPSSRTLLSIASMMAMTYPSHANLTTMIPEYTGALGADTVTPAELLASAGYRTFAFLHDRPLDYDPAGFDQGFAEFGYEGSRGALSRTVDERLVERALTAIGRTDFAAGQRFFGWVFLFSPHKPYEGDGQGSAIERQRGDIALADRAVGRLIDELERSGQLDRTIIIVTADHGEEFGEHGRDGSHGLTLYDEVVHVPLVVQLPGVRGGTIESPTLVSYALPWLLSSSEGRVGDVARERIATDFAPMMEATSGGVVIELIDRYRMVSAWADGEHKVIYDFFARAYQTFALAADPGEQTPLDSGSPKAVELRARMDRYRAQRACRERIHVTEIEATPVK